MKFPALNEDQHTALMATGTLLISIQSTEHLLHMITATVLPSSTARKYRDLIEYASGSSKKTLGAFITALRQHTTIEPEFEKKLTRFLEMRNIFAHNIAGIPGYSLQTSEGIEIYYQFLLELLNLNHDVGKVLFGLARAWQKQNNLVFENFDADHFYIKHIDTDFIPLVEKIFSPKR